MNVEKLYALAAELKQDEESKVVQLLENLNAHLQNQVNTPQNPTYQQSVAGTFAKIKENLNNAPSNNFHNDWKDMMCDLEVEGFYGKLLWKKIDNIFSKNQITPSLALKEIKKLNDKVKNNKKHFDNMVASFVYFGMDWDCLEEGGCEISIMIPGDYCDNKMDKLGDELKHLSKNVLRPFVEASGQTPDGFVIKGISSSDPTIYIVVTVSVAYAVMKGVEKAVNIYKSMLEIKELRNKTSKLDVGESVLIAFDKDIEKKLKELSQKYAKEYIDEVVNAEAKNIKKKEIFQGRSEKELLSHIESSIMKLVKRYDNGFSINVHGELHGQKIEEGAEEPAKLTKEQEQENKLIEEIHMTRKKLTYRNNQGKQLSGLLTHTDDEPSSENDSDNK